MGYSKPSHHPGANTPNPKYPEYKVAPTMSSSPRQKCLWVLSSRRGAKTGGTRGSFPPALTKPHLGKVCPISTSPVTARGASYVPSFSRLAWSVRVSVSPTRVLPWQASDLGVWKHRQRTEPLHGSERLTAQQNPGCYSTEQGPEPSSTDEFPVWLETSLLSLFPCSLKL